MSKCQKVLYAVELDISAEAACQGYGVGKAGYWVIHEEFDDTDGGQHLCVFETKKEALKSAKGRDHASRVVKFVRAQ